MLARREFSFQKNTKLLHKLQEIKVSFLTKPRSVYVYKLITLNAWTLIVSKKRKD